MIQIPLALQPHHDGSALYVPNQKPKLLDKVKLRVRIHRSIGKVANVRVRYTDSGEPFPTAPARVLRTVGDWVWYEATLVMHNPEMHY